MTVRGVAVGPTLGLVVGWPAVVDMSVTGAAVDGAGVLSKARNVGFCEVD